MFKGIPEHITSVRAGRTVSTLVKGPHDTDIWKAHHYESVSLAKKACRGHGGPRSTHRTLKSLKHELGGDV